MLADVVIADTSRLPGEESDSEKRELLLSLHRRMLEIRFFEDEVMRLFMQNLVRGSTHLYQGQEAVAVGACTMLRAGDTMTCTYRGHGAVLAMGAPLDRSMAEILGKANGLCRGKGGSMHLTDVSVGALGSFAVVGAHLPFTAGTALAAQYLGTGAVSLAFFGDGTTNIGAFHEALNLAAIWKLPAVFVCENNLYGEYSPLATTTPVDRLTDRAGAYAMAAEQVDGNDVLEVRRVVRRCGGAGAGGRWAVSDRGAHLPTKGTLANGPGCVPTARRARKLVGARSDHAPRARAHGGWRCLHGRTRARPCRGGGDRPRGDRTRSLLAGS